jgi:hypothetical protein
VEGYKGYTERTSFRINHSSRRSHVVGSSKVSFLQESLSDVAAMVEVCVVDKNDAQCHRNSNSLQNAQVAASFDQAKNISALFAALVEGCKELRT